MLVLRYDRSNKKVINLDKNLFLAFTLNQKGQKEHKATCQKCKYGRVASSSCHMQRTSEGNFDTTLINFIVVAAMPTLSPIRTFCIVYIPNVKLFRPVESYPLYYGRRDNY